MEQVQAQVAPTVVGPAAAAFVRAQQLKAQTFAGLQPTLPVPLPSGETIMLRPPRLADADAIVAACRDPEAVRWTTVPDPYHVADAITFVTRHTEGRWAAGTGAIFAIADPHDRYAGSISLDLTGPTTGDVGYLVAPVARGRGYASAALRALYDWAFAHLGLHRIEWRAYVGNLASRRVAEKAGFTIEGLARAGCVQRGHYRDAWTGARLSTDAG